MEFCIFVEPQQGASYDDQLAVARAAEGYGFTGFFRSDHFLRMGPGDPSPGPTDSWITLAGLARETSTIRLGTLVSSATFRHPSLLAIEVAQVDAMSGGRVELGLGTGWFEAEHRAYGIPFPRRRFGLLEEQLEIITGLWSTPPGETFAFAGAEYELDDGPALPKPVQERIPVIIGGGGPVRTPDLAARFATEFNIGFRPDDEIAETFARVREACERVGRDPATLSMSVALTVLAGEDDAVLERRAAAMGTTLAEFRRPNTISGTADDIARRVDGLAAIGVDRLYLQVMDIRDLGHIDYLGAVVLPRLPRT